MRRFLIVLAIFSFSVFSLTGCGGGDNSSPELSGLIDQNTPPSSGDTGGTPSTPTPGTFILPPATITVGSSLPSGTMLSIGGQAIITAFITDDNGSPIADGTLVNFSTDKGSITKFSTTEKGKAVATFLAGTDGGVAEITAQVSTDDAHGGALTGKTLVEIATGSAISLVVDSVTPQQIGIIGGGKQEISLLKFGVVDSYGNPAPDGTQVDFALNTSLGGGGNSLPTAQPLLVG